MPHLEAASILLIGPTLKKFNDRGMSEHLSTAIHFAWLAEFVVRNVHLNALITWGYYVYKPFRSVLMGRKGWSLRYLMFA